MFGLVVEVLRIKDEQGLFRCNFTRKLVDEFEKHFDKGN